METFEEVKVTRMVQGKAELLNDRVVTETPFTIWLNGRELATIICTPEFQGELAAGFLFSERVVSSGKDILSMQIDEQQSLARIDTVKGDSSIPGAGKKRFITPGCFFGAGSIAGVEKIESTLRVESSRILRLISLALKKSTLYRMTGGVHSAALCSPNEILIFREDIGRHNAIDKVIGHCILGGVAPGDHILITSGRISSALIGKIINARIPIIASSSAPTTEAIKLARCFCITLIGFARGKRITLYSGKERISDLR
jgi:FdhD protein